MMKSLVVCSSGAAQQAERGGPGGSPGFTSGTDSMIYQHCDSLRPLRVTEPLPKRQESSFRSLKVLHNKYIVATLAEALLEVWERTPAVELPHGS